MPGQGTATKVVLAGQTELYAPSSEPVMKVVAADGTVTVVINGDGSIPVTENVVESSAAAAFAVGPNGNTNPVFRVVGNVSSAATGVSITGRAAGAGADITVLSSGTNEALVINAKGSGGISLNPTGTGWVISPRGFLSTAAASGYTTGAGGTVTQATNKSTGVTLSRASGQITMNNAALAAGAEVTFTVTNTLVAATDVIVVNHGSAGTAGSYLVGVSEVGAGSFKVTVSNVSAGALSEAIVINFAVIKGASS